MQHFPPDKKAERWLDRRAAQDSRPPDEVKPNADDIEATINCSITSPPAAFPCPERVEGKSADSRARRSMNFVNFRWNDKPPPRARVEGTTLATSGRILQEAAKANRGHAHSFTAGLALASPIRRTPGE